MPDELWTCVREHFSKDGRVGMIRLAAYIVLTMITAFVSVWIMPGKYTMYQALDLMGANLNCLIILLVSNLIAYEYIFESFASRRNSEIVNKNADEISGLRQTVDNQKDAICKLEARISKAERENHDNIAAADAKVAAADAKLTRIGETLYTFYYSHNLSKVPCGLNAFTGEVSFAPPENLDSPKE